MSSLGGLNNRGDELLHEISVEQGWPVVVDEVDQQTLDMGTILEAHRKN